MRINIQKYLIIFSCLTLSTPAFACMQTSEAYFKTPEETVKSAENIHLVVLRSAQRHDPIKIEIEVENYDSIVQLASDLSSNSESYIHYSFDVLETIKGPQTNSIQLSFPNSPIYNSNEISDNHPKDGAFWSNEGIGRAIIAANCSITADFNFSDTYLLVLPRQASIKSFESVTHPDDNWLKYVRRNSAMPNTQK